MPPRSLKQAIYRVFTKQHGLPVTADASRYLEDLFEAASVPEEDFVDSLLHIVQAFVKQDGEITAVTRSALEPIVESLQRATEAAQRRRESGLNSEDGDDEFSAQVDITQHFHVIDVFDTPCWEYVPEQKTFLIAEEPSTVCASAHAKAAIFRSRYNLLRQRMARNELFCPPAYAGATSNDYLKITSIQSLLGCEGEQFLLFGMLSQIREGSYYLEDLESHVELDLSECVFTTGIFTENCFVLAEGIFTEDGVFKTKTLGLPPPENREATMAMFGSTNFFGGPKEIVDQETLSKIEKVDFGGECFVILSDVWLDQPKTLAKLRRIFEGFVESIIPVAFIFCGNFMSEPYLFNGQEANKYREGFNALADIISEMPDLAECFFVFVPGANDPWGGNVLPRPPIPDFFVSKLKSKVSRAIFATNPCRIKYCTQEIVIFREDLLAKLRRNAIQVPSNHDAESRDGAPINDLKRHLVRTVCDQAHLCPVLLSVRPVYWSYDHALSLYPLPHTLILADNHDRYMVNYEGCHCINPGSFSTSEYKFLVHFPGSRTTQASEV